MSTRQLIFALSASIALLAFVIEMVRRRKLREEYSWLWILVSVGVLVLATWYKLLAWLTDLIGAVVPASTLFVFGILFLLVVNVHFTIQISALTTKVKNQAQQLAILDAYVREARRALSAGGEPLADCAGPGECMLFHEQPIDEQPAGVLHTHPAPAGADGLAAQELS